MRPTNAFVNSLFLTLLFLSSTTLGQTAIIPTSRGWYDSTGAHNRFNMNYIVGISTDSTGTHEHRNFFVFDVSSARKPILSANLTLETTGYSSPDSNENYELHDVVTQISALIAGTGGVAAYNDLGEGTLYGGRSMAATDVGTVINIPLNSSAIDALNDATGVFAIGGSITTLSHFPSDEAVFGFSTVGKVTLQLTTVPEPGATSLFAFGLISLPERRRRR